MTKNALKNLISDVGLWGFEEDEDLDESGAQASVQTSSSSPQIKKDQSSISLTVNDAALKRYIVTEVDKNNTPEFKGFVQQLKALGSILKDDGSLLMASLTAAQQQHSGLKSADIVSVISGRKVLLEQASAACRSMIEGDCTEQTKSTQAELDGVNSEIARLKNELRTLESRQSKLSSQVSEYVKRKTDVLARLQKIVADFDSVISDRLKLVQQYLK